MPTHIGNGAVPTSIPFPSPCRTRKWWQATWIPPLHLLSCSAQTRPARSSKVDEYLPLTRADESDAQGQLCGTIDFPSLGAIASALAQARLHYLHDRLEPHIRRSQRACAPVRLLVAHPESMLAPDSIASRLANLDRPRSFPKCARANSPLFRK